MTVALDARPTRFAARTLLAQPERVLLLLWVALLGVQLPAPIANLRLSPSDAIVVALLAIALVRRRSDVLTALRPSTPVHWALTGLALALAWGTVVAVVRTGGVAREGWLNKDIGWFVLAGTVLAVRVGIRGLDEARQLIAALVVGGSVVSWVAAIGALLFAPEGAIRFEGFLLNPSANGLFLSVVLAAQLGMLHTTQRPSVRRLGVANAIGLTLLVLATLSRSTWIALVPALAVLSLTLMRDRKVLPLALAAIVAIASIGSLSSALGPVIDRLASGAAPTPRSLGSAEPTAAGTVPAATVAPAPSVLRSVPPQPTTAFVDEAARVAADTNGASDRIALDALAIRFWLSSAQTAVTGLGLGVFMQLVASTAYGIPIIVHSTYLWLPVEMGIPGIIATLVLMWSIVWAVRVSWQAPRDVAIAIFGGLAVIALWIAVNEGSSQRTLWLLLGLASVRRPIPS